MFPETPRAPGWIIPWATIDPLPWMQAMKGVPQDPIRHAEGDVWTHIHMVVEALVSSNAWRDLDEHVRTILFRSTLLHDVAKPMCTKRDDAGNISSRGHSWNGAIKARSILWKLGVPFTDREAICGIIRHHLAPFFLASSEEPKRKIHEVTQIARADWLTHMATADARGRICSNLDHLLEQIELFKLQAQEENCFDCQYQFPTPHSRFLYFRNERPTPDAPAYEEFKAQVIVMSGLPGAGKDYWIEKNLAGWPKISLDEIRRSLRISPTDPQGAVVNRAKEIARGHLRTGTNFVWNATNLSRNLRSECIRLMHDYRAHIKIVYIEAQRDQLFQQNNERQHKVPGKVIEKLLTKWEVPDLLEAHEVEHVLNQPAA